LISCQEKEMEEFVVIGGGLMGSAAAWQLSNNGQKVLLVEQQDSLYTFGSSFGEARISRSLGPKNDIWSYLQQRSVIETQKLIDYLNEKAASEKHKMEDIYNTSPVTYIYYKSQLRLIEKLLDGQTDKYEYASTPEEAATMFGVTIADTAMVIREYKKYSGTLNPKVLISKLHRGIQRHGNPIWYNHQVKSLKRKGDLYEIKITNTKTGETKNLLSRKVISAAGPYTGTLLKDIAPYFNELINPQRVFLGFFKIDKNRYNSYTAEQKNKIIDFYPIADLTPIIMFSWIEKIDHDGIPIFKIGGHFLRNDISDLDEVWKKELTKEEIEWGKNNTLNYFKFLNIPLNPQELQYYQGYPCVYSLTKTEVPLVTNIIAENNKIDPNFVVLAGMSGVGAKGTLTYGLIGANLLLEKEEPSVMYQKTKNALGFNRLLKDLSLIND